MDLDEKVTITKSKSSKLENELGDLKSDLEATQSKRDTQKTAYEDQIKSLDQQIAELKGKSADVDDRLDAEYDYRLAFYYKCIMFVLMKEYPELNMGKLEAGMQEYMAEQGQGNKDQGDQDQDKAPLSGEQEKEAGDPTLGASQESAPAPSETAGHALSEIIDPPSIEATEPPTYDP